MGNTHSENNNNLTSEKDLLRLQEQNNLQQELIKQQILKSKLNFSQEQLNNLKQDMPYTKNSSNPLLSNPQLQQEFFKNKGMQKQFLQMVMKQKNLHLDNEQYQQINNYLQQLNLEEEKELDEKKSFLYMNQSSDKYMPQKENKNVDFGTSTQQKDKLVRQILQQKKEQEEKMKREQTKRRKEYEEKLTLDREYNIDPYKILEIPKNASFNDMKNAYKRQARIYHPDKFGGNGEQFKIITKAFMILIEKYKREQQDKQFTSLKEESRVDMEKQLNESKKHTKLQTKQHDIGGNNFNKNLFNKIYEENKLYNPGDEGYGNWSKETEYKNDETPKLFSNEFNLNVFNSTFSENKPKSTTQITKYQEPEALPSIKGAYQELGQGNINDYSGGNNNRGGVQFTDYKKAHTETTLIDPNSINYKEYSSVDDLQKERGKKMFLTKEEQEQIDMNKMLEKQREEQRQHRLRQNDDRAFTNFAKVNKMFINR